jgi:hypothetical protein
MWPDRSPSISITTANFSQINPTPTERLIMQDAIDHSNGFLYLTAARGIQDFILRGNKVREMVGGSQIVDQLTDRRNGILFELLQQIGIDYQDPAGCRVLTAAAGGARLWLSDGKKAKQLFRLWPLMAGLHAPGIEVLQVLMPVGKTLVQTLSSAETELARQRNRAFPRLPQAGPLVARAPRTGEPAIGKKRMKNEAEWCDAQQAAKQEALKNPQNTFGLAHRISQQLKLDWNHDRWPFDFADITNHAGERSYLLLFMPMVTVLARRG